MNKSIIISGSGGQGIISIGTILANALMLNDLHVTLCSSYGAEMRGGAVNCEINVSDKEINTIQNNKVDYLIALNQASYDKFSHKIKNGGIIIANSSLVSNEKSEKNIKHIFTPLSEEANRLGNIKYTNSIALGILSKLLGNIDINYLKESFNIVLANKTELIEKNIEAYNFGFNLIYEVDS